MPNKDLKYKSYKIPINVINRIKNTINNLSSNDLQAKGLKRAQDMIDNKVISYSQINGLKNYFDTYEGDGKDDEYKLIGGETTKKWIDNSLEHDKATIKKNKTVRKDGGMENQFIKTHEKDKDNSNPTKANGGMIDVKNSFKNKNIMSNDAIYQESYNKQLNSMKYLIEYLSKK
jgi:hypothetical protein